MAEKRRGRRKKKRIWPWIVGPIVLILLAVGVYAGLVYKELTDTAKEIHSPLERKASDKRQKAVELDKKEPFSVLVLGVDEREGDKGRSDTMIVLTVNPKEKKTTMVSLPRDTYTEIVGKGVKDKINHAFAFGGVEMSMASVENLLDIPIDYVVQVNMESFKEIVDAVGGITVDNDLAFSQGQYTFPEGPVQINGDEALAYVRMRKQDPRGDFGRQDRQKDVIQGVIKKGASLDSLMNYRSIFGAISKNVRTNLTFDEMNDLQKNYRDATRNVNQIIVEKGQGQKMDGIWYYLMNDEELDSISSQLKQQLEITS
ncbi:polyisoprenyl-teichoic acid--peptidoglycan teichoic acid transferase TagU [Edaphobacillus lindanitolerans]|uniref:Polyisoprenyl-teichoic acid--peptidoglycan teichoic acid transferase TagU n=1 Tax=Edaphobacillus lindanitolerans TaxID=550447 RepID=A0A1U7PNT4_9BACI|nr:LytR family transcriptional regulator [Edaphobacillus lindanitolerans]SIT73729.1 transcriptional attenuator, LytR family [Edaphobacillus lindanitolerans]